MHARRAGVIFLWMESLWRWWIVLVSWSCLTVRSPFAGFVFVVDKSFVRRWCWHLSSLQTGSQLGLGRDSRARLGLGRDSRMLSRVSGTSRERSGEEGVHFACGVTLTEFFFQPRWESHACRIFFRPRWEPVRRLNLSRGVCCKLMYQLSRVSRWK